MLPVKGAQRQSLRAIFSLVGNQTLGRLKDIILSCQSTHKQRVLSLTENMYCRILTSYVILIFLIKLFMTYVITVFRVEARCFLQCPVGQTQSTILSTSTLEGPVNQQILHTYEYKYFHIYRTFLSYSVIRFNYHIFKLPGKQTVKFYVLSYAINFPWLAVN